MRDYIGATSRVHDCRMQFTVPTLPDGRPGHVGYLAGSYRDGALSDEWTDVFRCAESTFTAYVPGCSCGWYGSRFAVSTVGAYGARREWQDRHLRASTEPDVAPLHTTA